MALAGPRLDRPSAVGDEGRPRATSLTIASIVVVGLFAITGWVLGDVTLVLAVGVLVGLVAAGMGLGERTRLVDQFVGNLCLLGGGSLLVFVSLALLRSDAGVVIVGFTLAMLALALTWANVATSAGFYGALYATARSFVALLGWVLVAAIAAFSVFFVWTLLTDPVFLQEPIAVGLVFGLALAGAGGAIGVAIDRLPIVQLSPRSRRADVRRRIASVREASRWVLKGGIGFTIAVTGLVVLFTVTMNYRGIPLGRELAVVLGSPFVLGIPLLVAALGFTAAAVATAIRMLTGRMDTERAETIPAAAAGLAFLIIVPVAVAGLPALILIDPRSIILPFLLGPVVLIVGFVLVLAGMNADVVPDRAGGPALAAGALVLATVGAGLLELPSPLVLAIAAAALLVWDVSTFGLGVTAELGHRPETRRLELFHGVLTVGVGAVAVLLLSGVDLVRRTVYLGIGGPLAAAIAVATVFVAVAILRR